jgi:AcrR family transcriptional regulator
MDDRMASQIPSSDRTAPVLRVRQSDRRAASDRRMLDAAMRLIAERGAAGTSLGDIGIAAGYSRGLPSERFGSKLSLLEALIDRSEGWFQKRLDVALARKTGLDAVLARISAHLDAAMHDPMATAALYSLYVESISVLPELRPRIAAFSNGFQRGFADHLREGQRLGQIRTDVSCKSQAVVIVGAVRGLIIQSLIDRRPNDLQSGKKALLRLFESSLRAP